MKQRTLRVEQLETRRLLKTPLLLDELLPGNGGDAAAGIVINGEPGRFSSLEMLPGGDFNGDGFDDALISSGGVFVVFGSASADVSITRDDLDGSNGFRIVDGSVATTGLGDLNGDGFDELIVGDTIFFGQSQFPAEFGRSSTGGVVTTRLDRGSFVTPEARPIGDFDGDGHNDVLVSESRDSVRVLLGGSGAWPETIDLNSDGPSELITIDGAEGSSSFSPSATFWPVGDVNRDGRSDLAWLSGSDVRFVYGRSNPPATIEAFTELDSGNLTLTNGSGQFYQFSEIGPAGDLNGDSTDDLYILSTNDDRLFVVYGADGGIGADIELLQLDAVAGFAIEDLASSSEFLRASSVGDLNADGIDDIGAVVSSGTSSDSVGRLLVYFGSPNLGSLIGSERLDGNRGLAIESATPLAFSGPELHRLGDFNGDGTADILLATAGVADSEPEVPSRAGIFFGDDYTDNLPVVTIGDVSVTEATTRYRFEANAPWQYALEERSEGTSRFAVPEPDRVLSEDINMDGLQDIVAFERIDNFGGPDSARIIVMLNQGDDTYSRSTIAISAEIDSIRVGDVDNSSGPDIVGFSETADSMSILLNNGDATFQQPFVFSAGINPQDATLVDMDGDGDLDVFAINSENNESFGVATIENLGGAFFDSPVLNAMPRQVISIAVTDVNNDQTPDVVAVLERADGFRPETVESVQFFIGDGAGGLASGAAVELLDGSTAYGRPAQVQAADFDGDGHVDAVVSEGTISASADSGLWLVKGAPSAALGSVDFVPMDTRPESIDIADVDGDGEIDLLVDGEGTLVKLLIHNEAFTFNEPLEFLVPYGQGTAEFGDWDGDGDWDVLRGVEARNFGSGSANEDRPASVAVLRNLEGSLTAGQRMGVGSDPIGLNIADLNDDGRQDIVLGLTGDDADAIKILFGDGALGVSNEQTVPLGFRPTAIASGDFNGDGHIDLIGAAPSSGGLFGGQITSEAVAVFLSDGSGGYLEPRAFAGDGTIDDLIVIDVDGDGDQDVIAVVTGSGSFSSADSAFQVFVNNGSGLFFRRDTNIPDDIDSYDVADLNNDNVMDILVSWSSGFSNNFTTAVLLGTAGGSFAEPDIVGEPGFNGIDGIAGTPVSIADFTGDGVLDAAIVTNPGSSTQTISIVPSIGEAERGETVVSRVGNEFSTLFAFDADLDGDQDLLATSPRTLTFGGTSRGEAFVYINDGTGFFEREEPELIESGFGFGGLVLSGFEAGIRMTLGSAADKAIAVDMNGDQFPDIITVDTDSGGLSIYKNVSVGTVLAEVVATLDRPLDREVQLDFKTHPGSATTRLDYQTVEGTLSIPAAQRSGSIFVEVDDDAFDELIETIAVDISAPQNAVIGDPLATVRIVDNDAELQVSIEPSEIPDSGGEVTLTIRRLDTGNESLTNVLLATSATDASWLPSSVNIPADQPAAVITLNVPATDATSLAITAIASGFASVSTELSIVREVTLPWQNPVDRRDVNNSDDITPIDALVIINYLNRNASGPLADPATGFSPPPYYDVNGDNSVTPLDALHIINYLNRLPGQSEANSPAMSNDTIDDKADEEDELLADLIDLEADRPRRTRILDHRPMSCASLRDDPPDITFLL